MTLFFILLGLVVGLILFFSESSDKKSKRDTVLDAAEAGLDVSVVASLFD